MVLSSEMKVGIMAGCGGSYGLGCCGSLAIGFALCSSFCFAFVEVLFWGRQGLYVGWFAGGRVGAVVVGGDCWAGCGGSYELSCRGSLALVNEDKASGASADRACADGACADEAFVDGACTDGACTGGACGDGACVGGACAGRAG